jgi:hypothetical protein
MNKGQGQGCDVTRVVPTSIIIIWRTYGSECSGSERVGVCYETPRSQSANILI